MRHFLRRYIAKAQEFDAVEWESDHLFETSYATVRYAAGSVLHRKLLGGFKRRTFLYGGELSRAEWKVMDKQVHMDIPEYSAPQGCLASPFAT